MCGKLPSLCDLHLFPPVVTSPARWVPSVLRGHPGVPPQRHHSGGAGLCRRDKSSLRHRFVSCLHGSFEVRSSFCSCVCAATSEQRILPSERNHSCTEGGSKRKSRDLLKLPGAAFIEVKIQNPGLCEETPNPCEPGCCALPATARSESYHHPLPPLPHPGAPNPATSRSSDGSRGQCGQSCPRPVAMPGALVLIEIPIHHGQHPQPHCVQLQPPYGITSPGWRCKVGP